MLLYIPGTRYSSDGGVAAIQSVLEGNESGDTTLDLQPRNLQIFRGHHRNALYLPGLVLGLVGIAAYYPLFGNKRSIRVKEAKQLTEAVVWDHQRPIKGKRLEGLAQRLPERGRATTALIE